ncbi:class I SAM-dependent methyltransferase [Fretibacter rubidus]|uniref:class I SAM-dependent methyltransferase n=1 Tax=Fretibacter rubidus TaxID=570162 RepID=UPI00352B8EFD
MPPINYSRNASVYDKRHLDIPSAVIFDILELAGAEPGAPMLDMAAGTGRVSVPFAEAGMSVTACDIADKMLGQIAAKTDRHIETIVASADALPFADDSYDYIVLARALYLIENWQGALSDMARVLSPQGYFIHEWGSGEPGTVIVRLRERLRERLLEMGVKQIFHPGARSEADVITALQALGFNERGAVKTGPGVEMTLQGFIDKIANRECSYLWGVSTEISEQAVAELTAWAQAEFGPLEQPIGVPGDTFWRVYTRT